MAGPASINSTPSANTQDPEESRSRRGMRRRGEDTVQLARPGAGHQGERPRSLPTDPGE